MQCKLCSRSNVVLRVAYPVGHLAGSYNFTLVNGVVLVTAGHVAARYRGVWPVNDSGEDTSGYSVPDTLSTRHYAPLMIVPRHSVLVLILLN